MIYGEVKGTIISKSIKNPENGNPTNCCKFYKMQLTSGNEAQLVKIKDYELNRDYNGDFHMLCAVNDWSFDGKSGQSVRVIGAIVGDNQARGNRRKRRWSDVCR